MAEKNDIVFSSDIDNVSISATPDRVTITKRWNDTIQRTISLTPLAAINILSFEENAKTYGDAAYQATQGLYTNLQKMTHLDVPTAVLMPKVEITMTTEAERKNVGDEKRRIYCNVAISDRRGRSSAKIFAVTRVEFGSLCEAIRDMGVQFARVSSDKTHMCNSEKRSAVSLCGICRACRYGRSHVSSLCNYVHLFLCYVMMIHLH